jgi:hypothetical protein
VVSDLLGVSGLRILWALARGESDPKKLAALGEGRLRCSEEQLIADTRQTGLSRRTAQRDHRRSYVAADFCFLSGLSQAVSARQPPPPGSSCTGLTEIPRPLIERGIEVAPPIEAGTLPLIEGG